MMKITQYFTNTRTGVHKQRVCYVHGFVADSPWRNVQNVYMPIPESQSDQQSPTYIISISIRIQIDKILVTLNNASDYRTNGLYQTPNPHPNPITPTLVRLWVSPIVH